MTIQAVSCLTDDHAEPLWMTWCLSVCLLIPGRPVNQSKTVLPLTTASDLARMQEANRMCAHC